MAKRKGVPVDGVLLLDKPSGISSNAALQVARRLLNARKAGHTGTLDPLASGLLPLCFGEATKFAGLMLDADKAYLATIRLGSDTTTGDAEGEVVRRGSLVGLGPERIAAVLEGMVGPQMQVPPMYSAVKHQGRALYHYGRAGETIERAARKIVVHEVRLLSIDSDAVQVYVRVSKGTYVRSLAEEVGKRLGCGAHLGALRREASAGLTLGEAVTLDALEAMPLEQRLAALRPVDLLVVALPRTDLGEAEAAAFRHGRKVPAQNTTSSGAVRIYGPIGEFLGVGEAGAQGVVPKRLLQVRACPHEAT